MAHKIILFLLVFTQWLTAQEIIKTSQKANIIAQHFQKNQLEWEVPISKTEKLNLQWYRRISSLSEKEGVQSFVGYKHQDFIATLSIHKGNISGNLIWNEETIDISTSEDGFITLSKNKEKTHSCGTCVGNFCKIQQQSQKHLKKIQQNQSDIQDNISILSDGVLRVYRLALPITYDYYSNEFNSDTNKIKSFWSEVEIYLNEIYLRDIGVKFEIVNNDDLIIKQSDNNPFEKGSNVVQSATNVINNLIGQQNYDVGMVIAPPDGIIEGLAATGGVYYEIAKAMGFAIKDLSTIGHEIGHLFGSFHTFTTGGNYSYYTEVDGGQSIMGYGNRDSRHFFSMVSIYKIWEALSQTGYYTDKKRSHKVSQNSPYDNIPFGIKAQNTPPSINKQTLKKIYTIPKNSFFQFHISATDREQKELSYYAHPSDIREKGGHAKFLTFKPSHKNNITFQTLYDKERFSEVKYSTPSDIGEYTFWLGVNDSQPQNENHNTLYDMYETKVNIIEGTPFKITSGYKQKYKTGEKITLTWNVDSKIFDKNSKVRILMSDNFGESFEHILIPSTENDGHCEIRIPHLVLGKKQHNNRVFSGLGIIKVEVIDHIAYDITNHNPNGGGFEIESSSITLQNIPKSTINAKANEIPPQANITATSTCYPSDTEILFSEKTAPSLITRTWIAMDKCDNAESFTQNIHIIPINPMVYPNPIQDYFKIIGIENIQQVKIYDSSGRLLKSFSQEEEQYLVPNLDKGIYIINIETRDKNTFTFKIIK